ncbi:MAG: TIGR03086 family protein [Acidimicrobiales bacterium]|nr:TIGR03086 family protein [Acidimicrobiales bacterium]
MADPVVIERLIDASPEEAFELITQPERLRRWQALSASVDLRVGGDYRMTVVPGNIAEGSYKEIDPGKRVLFTWGWVGSDDVPPGSSDVLIELEPRGAQTLVRLSHSGLDAERAASHSEGWNHYADRLAVAAQSGDAGVDPWSAAPEELDHLTAAEASWAICQQIMRRFEGDVRDNATPCADFTVHELVEHLMGSLRSLGGMAGSDVPEEIDAASAEDYIAQAAEPALAAWRSRGVDGEVPFGSGTAPAFVPAGIIVLEFFVHAWDFAQAIGVDFEAPDHLTAYVQSLADAIIRPDNRGEGKGFAAVQATASSDPVDALMAFTGRSVPVPA